MVDPTNILLNDLNQIQSWLDDQSEILTRAKVKGVAVKEHVLLRFAIKRLKEANETAHILMKELREYRKWEKNDNDISLWN